MAVYLHRSRVRLFATLVSDAIVRTEGNPLRPLPPPPKPRKLWGPQKKKSCLFRGYTCETLAEYEPGRAATTARVTVLLAFICSAVRDLLLEMSATVASPVRQSGARQSRRYWSDLFSGVEAVEFLRAAWQLQR